MIISNKTTIAFLIPAEHEAAQHFAKDNTDWRYAFDTHYEYFTKEETVATDPIGGEHDSKRDL